MGPEGFRVFAKDSGSAIRASCVLHQRGMHSVSHLLDGVLSSCIPVSLSTSILGIHKKYFSSAFAKLREHASCDASMS